MTDADGAATSARCRWRSATAGRADRLLRSSTSSILDGEDLRKLPLIERKERLRRSCSADQPEPGPLFYSATTSSATAREILRAGLRHEARGHRLQARRGALPLGADQGVAEDQDGDGPGVHRHRLAALDGEDAAVLVDPPRGPRGGPADLSRPRRQRLRRARAGRAVAGAEEARGEDAAGRRRAAPTSAARHAFRQAGAGRRDRLPRLDRRRLRPPGRATRGLRADKKAGGGRRRESGRRAAERQRRARRQRPRMQAEEAPRPAPTHGRQGAPESSSNRPRHRHARDRGRPRHPSRPGDVPRREDHQADADRLLPVGRRPHPAARRRPAAQPGPLPRRRAGRLLLPEARLAGLSRRLQARSASRRRRRVGGLPLHRGRARPGRGGADGRARAAHLGLARRRRWRSPTASSSTSTPTRRSTSPRSRRRRRRCATG